MFYFWFFTQTLRFNFIVQSWEERIEKLPISSSHSAGPPPEQMLLDHKLDQ